MKNLFFLFLLSTSFCLIGCGDDVEPEFITANINGDSFEAISIQNLLDTSGSEELVFILGTRTTDGVAIGLNIFPSIGTGSFAIEPDDSGFEFTNGPSGFATEGTLNLSTNDTNENVLEGTFNFVATDNSDSTNVFDVTNGEFRILY